MLHPVDYCDSQHQGAYPFVDKKFWYLKSQLVEIASDKKLWSDGVTYLSELCIVN